MRAPEVLQVVERIRTVPVVTIDDDCRAADLARSLRRGGGCQLRR